MRLVVDLEVCEIQVDRAVEHARVVWLPLGALRIDLLLHALIERVHVQKARDRVEITDGHAALLVDEVQHPDFAKARHCAILERPFDVEVDALLRVAAEGEERISFRCLPVPAVHAGLEGHVIIRFHEPREAPLRQLVELLLRLALVELQHLLVDKEDLLLRALPDQAHPSRNHIVIAMQLFLDWLRVHADVSLSHAPNPPAGRATFCLYITNNSF